MADDATETEPAETELAHQPGGCAAGDPDAFTVELRPDVVDPIDAGVCQVHPRNCRVNSASRSVRADGGLALAV
jgi:hypothetical protein